MPFHAAVREDELWEGELRAVAVAGRNIILFHYDHKLHAYFDACPHRGIALGAGRLDGCALTCPGHEWKFDLRTGTGINPADARLDRLQTKTAGGMILVEFQEAAVRSTSTIPEDN